MRLNLLATCAALAIVPTGAFAQNAPASGQPAHSSDNVTPNAAPVNSSGLGDIIVTAQRKEESAQRAAVPIDVVRGADLVASGVTQIGTLASLVPALTIQQIGNSTSTFIRGVGNFSVSSTSDPAVAFNYDGVYVGRLTATSGTFYDLERVEVLKGPQGTLYGRNATAGVINVLPTQPRMGENSGYGTVSIGNYDAFVTEGAINLAVGSRSAVRLSATITDRGGYLSNDVADDKTQGARLQFKTKINSDLTIRLAADYAHQGGRGPGYSFIERQVFNRTTEQFVVTPTNIPRSESFLSPASQAFYTSLGAGPFGNVRRTRDAFPETFRNNNFYGANAQIDYRTPIGMVTIIPAYRHDKVRNLNPAGGFPTQNFQKSTQYSVETRLAGTSSIIDYQIGFFYYHEHLSLLSSSLTFGSNLGFTNTPRYNTESYAPFARLTAHLAPSLRVVAGVRYTHDAKVLNSSGFTISAGCRTNFACGNTTVLPPSVLLPTDLPFAIPSTPGSIPGPAGGLTTITRSPTVIFDQHVSNSKFTYRGAVEYDVAPASLLYASLETGFRSGGFNTSVGFETFEPETITAFTLGSKNRFLNNRVQLNVEAFYWKYRNQQVAHPGFDKVGRAGSIVQNLGRTSIKGVEVDGRFLVTPTTTLSANVQYLDAKNKEFQYQVPAALASLTGCALTLAATPGVLNINCAGLPAFNAPKWTVNLAAEQRFPIGDYVLAVGADTQYRSSRYMGFEYQPSELQRASWTSNAQASFGPKDNRWSIAAFVRNIENDRLLAAPFSFGGVLVGYTTPPRTYGVRASAKF